VVEVGESGGGRAGASVGNERRRQGGGVGCKKWIRWKGSSIRVEG
jgi:hypothetical protein